VIVGRALTEPTSDGRPARRPPVREAAILIAAMLVATIVAIVMLHGMFAGA
jgi:hypothetical protein